MNKQHRHFFRVSFIFSGVLLAGITQQASAAGFQLIEQSVSGMGTAFAGGAAQAEDATTIYFNPAGMTRLEGSQGAAAFHIIVPQAQFDDNGSTGIGNPLGTEESGDAGVIGVAPNFYLSNQLTDNLFLGLGVNAPFGLATSYDDDWIGRYHAIDSEIMTININPSIAYKLNDSFSIGVGANAQYLKADLSNAIDTSFMIGGAADSLLELEGDDWGFGWNLGFLFEPQEGTRIGLHYRSKIKYQVEGEADFSGPILLTGIIDNDVKSDVELPATLSVSLYHDITPEWAVMFDYSRTYWHVLEELRFEFEFPALSDGVTTLKWEDSNRYALGLQHRPSSSNWTYRVGVAYDETPIPNSHYRTPRVPGEDRIWLAFGLGYKKSDNLSFDFGYAHLFVDDPRINKSMTDPENLTRGNLNGSYEASVDILSAQMSWKF
jgi:long-chain fatty acid transport protein